MELARGRDPPQRNRPVLDHRVRLPDPAGNDFRGVAHDRLRGRRVLLLGPVGMGEAPPRPPGGTAGRGVRLIRTPEPWKAYIPVSQSLFVGEPYRSRLGHDTMAKRTPKDLRGPKIVAVPPGPKSKAAMARKERFITNAVKVALPIDVTAAEGPFVQDADGNVYIDLGGGIGVQTAGHRPPSVIRAAKDELDRLTHISFMVATYAPYTDPQGLPPAECAKARVEEIERLINQPEVAGRVAAILAEPVQGEGGMIVPPKEFFPLLRKLCDAHGIVLVDDEVQAGMGRTGKLWAIEHWNTIPDILVSGKAVGGGLPFGGVTGKPAVMDLPAPGSLGGTFGGNPVVCAAALESIDVIQKALPKTKKLEGLIRKRLDEIFEGHDRVGEVRGIGAMWALEFVKDRRTKEPDVELARAVQLAGLKNGLVLLTAGFFNNCIRLLPPINIPLPLMTKALDLLEA